MTTTGAGAIFRPFSGVFPMADEKACTRCRIVKPLAEFTLLKRRSGKERASLCRKCDRERTRDMDEKGEGNEQGRKVSMLN